MEKEKLTNRNKIACAVVKIAYSVRMWSDLILFHLGAIDFAKGKSTDYMRI